MDKYIAFNVTTCRIEDGPFGIILILLIQMHIEHMYTTERHKGKRKKTLQVQCKVASVAFLTVLQRTHRVEL